MSRQILWRHKPPRSKIDQNLSHQTVILFIFHLQKNHIVCAGQAEDVQLWRMFSGSWEISKYPGDNNLMSCLSIFFTKSISYLVSGYWFCRLVYKTEKLDHLSCQRKMWTDLSKPKAVGMMVNSIFKHNKNEPSPVRLN